MSDPFVRDDTAVYQDLCFAVKLTKQRERIIVGDSGAIRRRLCGDKEAFVYSDTTRTTGTFLIDFPLDEGHEWNIALSYFCDALEMRRASGVQKIIDHFSGEHSKEEFEQLGLEILRRKYETHDPVCMFIALRMWFGYVKVSSAGRNVKEIVDDFQNDLSRLLYPLHQMLEKPLEMSDEQVQAKDPLFRWTRVQRAADMRMTICYPDDRVKAEYVLIKKSFLSVKAYYAEKLKQWKKYLIICAVCGRPFLADSRHYELCGESCREAAIEKNRENRNKNVDSKKVDKLCRNEYQYWYTRKVAAEKTEGFSPERLQRIESAMQEFRAGKTAERKRWKNREVTFIQLKRWFSEQRKIIDELRDNA